MHGFPKIVYILKKWLPGDCLLPSGSCLLPSAFRLLLSAFCLLSLPAPLHAQSAPRVWEAPLVIPTYELGPPDPNPRLLDSQRRGWHPVYPYPMLDTLTNHQVEKSYQAIFLENDYLRVTVLPELGGHLYAIFDKTTNRDVLYTNHAIKYALVAIRGAWVSGGIEWNFPDGHTLTTVSPIDYATRTDPDGSVSVTVGDTERVQRMQWAVTIRLRPGWKVVETEVTLNNRRETPGRYWFWATAAAHATGDMRFVYPMREAYPHMFWPVFSFPKQGGIDVGTYREVPNYLSLFARNSLRDFFGIYYEKTDWGVAHVADHRQVPGKKSWTWGTEDAGNIWIEKLTDRDGQYVEFQAGRFETQMEHEFMEPHRVERFTEYWYPVDRLGGPFDEANRYGALRVKTEGPQAQVTLNVNHRFEDAEITLEAAGRRLAAQRINLDPAQPFRITVDLPADAADKPFTVTVTSKERQQLIHYRTDFPIDGNPEFKPARRPIPDKVVSGSAEQAYFEGAVADKESRERVARQAYEEALRRDPGFAPAHVALGLSFYRSGLYDEAEKHLTAALLRNRYLSEAHYYLGLVLRALGQRIEAAEHLLRAGGAGYREAATHYILGEMALEGGNTTEAIDHLEKSVKLNPLDLKARTLLAMSERLANHVDSATAHIDAVVEEMPIDYLALNEQYKIHQARHEEQQATSARRRLWRLLSREPDSVLELVFDYAAVGQYGECRALLEEAFRRAADASIPVDFPAAQVDNLGPTSGQVEKSAGQQVGRSASQRVSKPPVYPMLHYTLGYFYSLNGESAKARAQYALGAAGDPAFVFPHRVEEIRILYQVLSQDARAFYYLGNALASKNRDGEALQEWRAAIRLDPSNPVAHRNLARALWAKQHAAANSVADGRVGAHGRAPLRPNVSVTREAVAEYEAAIKLAPDDFHLYLELDRLMAESKESRRRIALLESASPAARAHSSLTLALASAYADAGSFDKAVNLLEHNSFTSGEGETSGLAVYRRAHLGLARWHQKAGRHREAAAEFVRATEYPRNLGVGRSAFESHAREYVAAARELEAAGRREEAEGLWRRAADGPLNSPVQPAEPWSEHYYYKALALEHVGRHGEARALYQRLAALNDEKQMLENEPDPPEGAIRFLLAGLGLKALGRTAEARVALERVLKMEPSNEMARVELGVLKTR